MQAVRIAAVLVAALFSGACFQMTTVLKVNADGTGTIEHRMLYTTAALAQLRQFAALGGGGGGQPIDPLSEQQAQLTAASIGPGVTYVSSTAINTDGAQGREAIYAFTDVTQLRISTQPGAPGGLAIKASGFSTEGDTVTFSLTRDPAGTAVLHIHVPEPNFLGALASPGAQSQIAMIKSALAGAHVLLVAEPVGSVVKTSSPYADGNRVTLLEVDLDEVLKDETLLPRLQAAKTNEEAKAVLQNATGLKINTDSDITIEFTPAR